MIKLSEIRWQFWIAAIGYACVFVIAAILIAARHLAELNDPVGASGGMYAFGELLMYMFIACLFLIPTALLIHATAGYENFYTGYSKFLLALGVSAPICLGIFAFGQKIIPESLNSLCFLRLVSSPFVLAGLGFSRIVARFDRAKKLASYAFLIEGFTIVAGIAIVFIEWKLGKH